MGEEAYLNLSAKLRGSVITPASGEYEAARRVYNGMIDRRPDAIIRCADAADVTATVNFARNPKRCTRSDKRNRAGCATSSGPPVRPKLVS
jgi:hypothetical protein